MKSPLAMILAIPLLASCATAQQTGGDAPALDSSAGSCRNDGLQQFQGRAATAELGSDVLRVSGATTLQWVASGTMVTMEYRANRVRVWLDEQNRVSRVNCG